MEEAKEERMGKYLRLADSKEQSRFIEADAKISSINEQALRFSNMAAALSRKKQ